MKKAGAENKPQRKMRPAMSPEARENQLISYAIDLVEKRLIEGTASSQETTHFLKLGSTKAQLEKELLKKQVELAAAKTESLKSGAKMEELYQKAMNAMRRYSGEEEAAEEDGD